MCATSGTTCPPACDLDLRHIVLRYARAAYGSGIHGDLPGIHHRGHQTKRHRRRWQGHAQCQCGSAGTHGPWETHPGAPRMGKRQTTVVFDGSNLLSGFSPDAWPRKRPAQDLQSAHARPKHGFRFRRCADSRAYGRQAQIHSLSTGKERVTAVCVNGLWASQVARHPSHFSQEGAIRRC